MKPPVPSKPPVVDGTAALRAAMPFTSNLLVNADVWTPAHEVAAILFPDMADALEQHWAVCDDLCRAETLEACADRKQRLERCEWAVWHRYLQAAYVLGIAVGSKGGAR